MTQPAAISACHAVLPHLKGTTESNTKGWGRGHTANRASKQCTVGRGVPGWPLGAPASQREQAAWPKAPQPGRSRQGTPEPMAKWS